MTALSRRRTGRRGSAPRRPAPAASALGDRHTASPPAAPCSEHAFRTVQRGWWIAGILAGLVGALGVEALPPSTRLAAVERANVRQDSLFSARSAAQQQRLGIIRRQVGQLLTGQCAKERDRMARVVYGCD